MWPGKWALPAGAVSSVSFFMAQLVLPRCRFSTKQFITPLNWMLLAFGSQLILMPALVRLAGPSIFPLPSLTSEKAINFALFLITASFWAFCIAVHAFRRSSRSQLQLATADESWIPGRGLAFIFIIVGLAGVSMAFGTFDRLIEYLTNPVVFMLYAAEAATRSATLAEAAGTFLKPFLGFGFLLLWCRAIDLPLRQGEKHRWFGRVFLIAMIAISYALMTYNRGAFAVPMVAMIAVLSKRLPKKSMRYLFAAGAIFAALLGAVTLYKSAVHSNSSGTIDKDFLTTAAGYIDVMGTVQLYGQAPQYLGYFVERNHYGSSPTAGTTLVASVMNPVPILGKPFRSHSGVYLYNLILGRNPENPDQIPQLTGELFLDFNIFGILLGFGTAGWAIARLQSRFDASRSALEVYIVLFASIWMGFLTVGSIDVIAQIALYSSLPIYVFLFYKKRRQGHLVPQKRLLMLRVVVDRSSSFEGAV
jgi:fumarate reductase subunit C